MEDHTSKDSGDNISGKHDEPVILFHRNCLDGSASAWGLFQRFGNDADYIPVGHGNNPQDAIDEAVGTANENKDIYVVDYTPSEENILHLLEHSKSVTIADHHPSAIENSSNIFSDNLTVIYNPNESGATLTWDTLVREHIPTRDDPWFLEDVKRIDLGTAEHLHDPETEHITTILDNVPRDDFWKTIEAFSKLDRLGKELSIKNNDDLIQKDEKEVTDLISKTQHISASIKKGDPEIKIPIVDAGTEISNVSRNLWKEMGKDDVDSPIVMAYYIDDDDIAHVSLRHNIYSNSETDISVDEIAKHISQDAQNGGRETAAVMHVEADFLSTLFSKKEPNKNTTINVIEEKNSIMEDKILFREKKNELNRQVPVGDNSGLFQIIKLKSSEDEIEKGARDNIDSIEFEMNYKYRKAKTGSHAKENEETAELLEKTAELYDLAAQKSQSKNNDFADPALFTEIANNIRKVKDIVEISSEKRERALVELYDEAAITKEEAPTKTSHAEKLDKPKASVDNFKIIPVEEGIVDAMMITDGDKRDLRKQALIDVNYNIDDQTDSKTLKTRVESLSEAYKSFSDEKTPLKKHYAAVSEAISEIADSINVVSEDKDTSVNRSASEIKEDFENKLDDILKMRSAPAKDPSRSR